MNGNLRDKWKKVLDRGGSRCKDPLTGESLVNMRTFKQAFAAEEKREQKRVGRYLARKAALISAAFISRVRRYHKTEEF